MLSEDIRAVIWDLDGTLLDTENMSHRSWLRAAKELGIDCEADELKKIIGMNQKSYLKLLSEILGSEELAMRLKNRTYEHNQKALDAKVPIKEGALKCVGFLAEAGIPQAIATSSSTELARKKLGPTGMVDKFDAIATGDEIEYGKPAPDIFLLAAKRINVPPSHCLAFEDSKYGIVAAKTAKMFAALIPDIVEHSQKTLAIVDYHFDSLETAFISLKDRFQA